MSYRLITKGAFKVVTANDETIERACEIRAYGAPKREADGQITVDGVVTAYRLTGGKGRGTAVKNYLYATVKGESAYIEITEKERAALKGSTITLTSEVVKVEETKSAEEAKPAETPAAPEIPAKLTRAQRRAAAKQAA